MATKRKTANPSASVKRPSKNTDVVATGASAVPPPDDPLARFEDMTIDRLVSAEQSVPLRPGALLPAAAAAVGRSKRGGRSKLFAANGHFQKIAERRLDAMQQSRAMRHIGAGHPLPAGLASTRATAAGGEMVAPVPGTSNWVQMGPTAIPNGQTYSAARVLVTGRVTAIVLDPTNTQNLYVGSAQGGVWKSVDGGRHWTALTDNEVSLAIGALAMDPANPQILYAGTGEGNFSQDSYYGNGILQTNNGGNSWTTLGASTFLGTRFSRIVVSPGASARLFAATGNGVYRSTNSGMTWTQMTNGLPFGTATDVAVDPSNTATVYAALWNRGIYRTQNADMATPTLTQLTNGLPTANTPSPGGITRIALAVSPSSPQTVYALMANNDTTSPPPGPPYRYAVDKFYVSTDGGDSWIAIALPGGSGTGIGGQGFYNLNVLVDPTTPDIAYLSGISLWKATRDAMTGVWTVTDIGGPFHPDNHALAIDPTNHLNLFAGSDGGIYQSTDGGMSWSDAINSGLCITQFEFMAQHPASDAVVICGTQDNGTEQFRNSPVFYHSDDGDGGSTAYDSNQPVNVLSTYYGPSPKRSTQAGKFGTWISVAGGLQGNSLFYPPMALDETNPSNVAFGTNQVNLDAAQGTGGWPTHVALPGIGMRENVSALHYVNSNLIYVGSTLGKVYRLAFSMGNWTATALHAAPLPGNWIWEIRSRPDNVNAVIVAMSGFNISHVWRGDVPANGPAAWTNVSGTGAGTTLPDIPVNALAIDPSAPDTYYIGTDIAVYRTTNAGTAWTQFSQGLPNCAIFDLKLHTPTRLLRVATHGRGMWERKLDVAAMPDVDLFFRDHLMDTGRWGPAPPSSVAGFEDPLQHVSLGDGLAWYMCADIKVDALEGSPPAYQMNVSDVDYVTFESRLGHRNPQRGQINRAYIQAHNRGIQPATAVTVKSLYADATAGLPPLPTDFWTAFPGNSVDTSVWHPIGSAQTIATVSPTEPAVLEWDWNTPTSAADHSCLLVVMDSPTDPIPAANKIFNVNQLVGLEKHVGLKNLHVVNAPPGTAYWTPFRFYGQAELPQLIKLRATKGKWAVGLLFQKPVQKSLEVRGISKRKLTAAELDALRQRLGKEAERYDTATLYFVTSPAKGGEFANVRIRGVLGTMLLLGAPRSRAVEDALSIAQEQAGVVVGGSTFILRTL
jgi:photosystem II stability/assembly factor-like uncharacterized protein